MKSFQRKPRLNKFVSGIIVGILVLTNILAIKPATIRAQQSNLAPQPTTDQCELVNNGNFESSIGGWNFNGRLRGSIVEDPIDTSNHATRLGIVDEQLNGWRLSTAYQSVQIPQNAEALQLSYRFLINGLVDEKDYFQVQFLKKNSFGRYTILQTVTKITTGGSAIWEDVTFDLMPYANLRGQEVLLYFEVSNDGSKSATSVYIDDVALSICNPPLPPTASLALAPQNGNAPLDVVFDASASSDPDGSIVGYQWIFGDGETGSGINITHTYSFSGTYTPSLTVTDTDGLTATASQTVTVSAPEVPTGEGGLPPDPSSIASPLDGTVATNFASSTAFLYTGVKPIQTGVAPGTIRPIHATVIRGRVLDQNAQPLSGVKVALLNHPEFGQTLSREDGMFDMAVNGGGLLTLQYSKIGYLTIQRQVDTYWQEFSPVADVVLTPYDSQVTNVDLTQSTKPFVVAQGGVISDTDGVRQATLLFPKGIGADMVMPNGDLQPLEKMSVRVTEYTVGENGPKAMPAELPSATGYTYAAEFSVDEAVTLGAREVSFTKPIYFYLENFINAPVGSAVPAGYYDRQQGKWIASNNGRVIAILNVANGVAELDTDGNNSADNAQTLTALGITDDERVQLAELYPQAPKTLWRIPIMHFSPWDFNWPFGLPSDAQDPNQDPKPSEEPENKPCETGGSIIECQNQIMGERLPLVGLPFTLNYRSDRSPGYLRAHTIQIPVSGANLPESLKRIQMVIYVAGRAIEFSFSRQPNQSYTFHWDGRDVYGRILQGSQPISIKIGYVYQPVYYTVRADFERSFSQGGNVLNSANPTRFVSRSMSEIISWRTWSGHVTYWDAREYGLGGWSLDMTHLYDPLSATLYMGDGGRRNVQRLPEIITTVAGNGQQASAQLFERPANQVGISYPHGVVIGSDGSVYFTSHQYVLRIDSSGILHRFAGNNESGFAGDGGPAISARLTDPRGLALGPDGSVYIADMGNHVIRKVSSDGTITTIAGMGGQSGFSGDGGPALQAKLNRPSAVAVSKDGILYIVDVDSGDPMNKLIRRVGTDGRITTYYRQKAAFALGITIGTDNNLYLAEAEGKRIQRIAADGSITTVVNVKDGIYVQSLDATIPFQPLYIDMNRNGTIFALDTCRRLWRVRAEETPILLSGIHSKGCATNSYGGEGAAVASSGFYLPDAIAVAPDDKLYIADTYNHRIRRIAPALPGFDAGDIVVLAEDGSELYEFDPYGKHIRTRDVLLGTTLYTFSYTTFGHTRRLTSITDANGQVTRIERDDAGKPLAIVAPFGQRTTLTLDALGYLRAIANPLAETTTFTYTASGLLTHMTDPRGYARIYTYESDGRLATASDPAGGSQMFSRTPLASGYKVSRTTSEGRTTTYQVEQLSTTADRWLNQFPSGATSKILWQPDGEIATTHADGTVVIDQRRPDPRFGMQTPLVTRSVISTPGKLEALLATSRTVSLITPGDITSLALQTDTFTINNRSYTSVYQAANRQFTLTSPAGRQRIVLFNEKGRMIKEQIAGLAPVFYQYNDFGQLDAISQGEGEQARLYTFQYDFAGYLTQIQDPLMRLARFGYDEAGRITQQQLPGDRTIGYTYDANGNIQSITPPGKPAHTFAYTPVDLQAVYTPPDVDGSNTATSYTYNRDQQLTQLRRPDGKTIAASYDFAGRTQAITIERGTIAYQYHPTTSNVVGVSAPNGINLNFAYDGSLLTEQSWTGPIAGNITYGYDNSFRRTSISINAADTITYTYDKDSLLTSVGDLGLVRNLQNGLLAGSMLGNVTDSYGYNSFGAPISYTAGVNGIELLGFQYGYDKLGRIVTRTETISEVTDVYNYGYDLAGRLETVQKNGMAVSRYSYDLNGNRLSFTDASGVITATYDAQDRLLKYGNATYTYTANGELQTKTVNGQTTTYTYDELGNLVKAVLPDGTGIEYLIDGLNRRMGKKVNGELVQGFLYDGQLRIVAELDGAGNVISRFVYATHINVPDYMIKADTTYRILTDHLGSPNLIVDVTTGAVIQKIIFDEFGRVLSDTNWGFQPFGFAGGFYDKLTELEHFGTRDFEAPVGRWITKDLLGLMSGPNLYSYVTSDPVNLFDPIGLDFADWVHQNASGFEDLNIQPFADFSAGYGDILTGIPFTDSSLTGLIRQWQGTDRYVNRCSDAYWGGMASGVVWQIAFNARGVQTGHEFKFGFGNRKFRVAPWGNRTQNSYGQRPHYHRNVPDPNNPGQSIPGGGIGKHRPWEGW